MEKMDFFKVNEEGQLYVDFDSLSLIIGEKAVAGIKQYLMLDDIEGINVVNRSEYISVYIVSEYYYYIFRVDEKEGLYKKTRIHKFDLEDLVEEGGIIIYEAIKF